MKNIFIISLLVSALFLFGCKKEPSSVDQELQVDALVEQQAAFGWQANQLVQTGNEIEEVTKTSDLLEVEDVDTSLSTASLKKEIIKFVDRMNTELPEYHGLAKPQGDTVIIEINKPWVGKRGKLIYYSDTDILRIYEVKYDVFAPWQAKTYDSLQVITKANGTIYNMSDDSIRSSHNTKLYRETGLVHMESVVSDLEVTDYEGLNIAGLILTQEINYYTGQFLTRTEKYIEINPDQSGTLREDFDYSDGTTAYRSVTFYPDNTGEFSKLFRDGTTVNGTFDSIEDDMHGEWTEEIDFPVGRYVDKIEKEAEVWITPPDSIFEGSFSEIIYFATGNIDSSSIDITIKDSNDLKITVLEIEKKNNAHGTLRLEEDDISIDLTGTWTTWNGYFIEISDTKFNFDGSGHIHYEVWVDETSYLNNEDPIIVVDYYFSQGGDGNGTISYEGESYDYTTNENGEGVLSKGGKTKSFNLIQ